MVSSKLGLGTRFCASTLLTLQKGDVRKRRVMRMIFFMMVVFNNGEWIIENGELNWMEGVLLWRMFFMMVVLSCFLNHVFG